MTDSSPLRTAEGRPHITGAGVSLTNSSPPHRHRLTGPPHTAAQLSPNQLEKQRQIVKAAQLVLARDGLAGCTVRAIAEAGPLTKSAIHYYFADLDDLVDRAIAGHIAIS